MKPGGKYSSLVRAVCGELGFLGAAAIAFNAVQVGGLRINLMLVGSLFAGLIFLYVAIFGTNPLDFRKTGDNE